MIRVSALRRTAIASSKNQETRFRDLLKVLGFAMALLWPASALAEAIHVDGHLASDSDVFRRTATDIMVSFDLGQVPWARTSYVFSAQDASRMSFDADLFLFGRPPKKIVVSVVGYDRNAWDLTDVLYEGETNWVPGTTLTVDVHKPDLRKQIERRLSGAFRFVQSSRNAVTSYIDGFYAAWIDRKSGSGRLQRQEEAGDTFLQFRLAQSYERSRCFYALAYKWYAIAADITANGRFHHERDPELAKDAASGRDRVAAHLSPDQLADTKKLVESWRPNLKGCHASFFVRQKNGGWWNDAISVCTKSDLDQTQIFRFTGGATF